MTRTKKRRKKDLTKAKENAKTPSSTKNSNKSPSTICIKAEKVKTKKTSKNNKEERRKSMSYALAMKFEQLHDALEQTQLALLKEKEEDDEIAKAFARSRGKENNKEKVSTVVGRAETTKKTEKKKSDVKDTTCVLCNEINDAVKVTMRCVECNCFCARQMLQTGVATSAKEWRGAQNVVNANFFIKYILS